MKKMSMMNTISNIGVMLISASSVRACLLAMQQSPFSGRCSWQRH
jgi:hypothetical protein